MIRSAYIRLSRTGVLFAALVGLCSFVPLSSAGAAPSAASRFSPSDPVRLVDTRDGTGSPAAKASAGTSIAIPVAGRIPAGATALVLNITVVNPDAVGFVTAYAGTAVPPTSSANIDQPGKIAANLAVVALSGSADVRLYTSMSTDLVVDLLGWFVDTAGDTSGRYRPVSPGTARVLDTRGESLFPPSLTTRRVLPIVGRGGVPATGVRAVALNLTVTDTIVPGWVQVIPTGGTTVAGASSNANVTRVGQTVANMVLVPVGADGTVTIVGSTSAHLLVDIAGWFTDATAPSGTDGLFITVDPARLADSRSGPKLAAGATLPVSAATADVDASRIGAVLTNLTLAESSAPGYVTGYAGSGPVPEVSNLNADRAGATVANVGIVVTNGTAFGLYSSASAHLIVDLLGWFTRSAMTFGGAAPGTVIATAPVADGLLVRYRSIGAAGSMTSQATLVFLPTGTPPAGGWPIMAIVHGPFGMGDSCAVTNTVDRSGEVLQWLNLGYAVVYPDLEGIGVDSPGDHPYLHGPGTGRSVLDAVRAARAVHPAVLSNKVGSIGFSSGAHGALWVGEMAPSYAPELDVRGLVSLDPVSWLSQMLSDSWQSGGFTPWFAQGQKVGDPSLDYRQILRPEAIALLPRLNELCFPEVYPLFDSIPGGPFLADPLTVPTWRAAFLASDPGSRPSPPVFLAGASDLNAAIPAIPHHYHDHYRTRACALGTSVRYEIFTGDHMIMLEPVVQNAAAAWLAAQMNGPAQTGCTSIG